MAGWSWKYKTDHVQEDLRSGQFASAESTLIAAGPPRLDQAAQGGTATVYPMGLIESMSVQQSKQLQRLFEIGSTRSYFIPGRVVGAVNLGRMFYYGPNLLRALYAYYKNDSNGVIIGTTTDAKLDVGTANERQDPNNALVTLDSIKTDSLAKIVRSPGEDYFFIDLGSDMFNQGTGLATYFKDSNNNLIGAMYMEDNYVQGHQMSVSSGSVLIMEGCSMQFDRIVPIKVMA